MTTRKTTTTTRRTTKTGTTTRKRATPAKKAAAAPKPAAEPAAAAVVTQEIAIIEQPEMRKKELIDLAVARSGVKKRDAKPAIEAALAVLGEALSQGRELNLRPMGKLKVTRMKKGGNGQIINARVRQPESDDKADFDPLAQAAE